VAAARSRRRIQRTEERVFPAARRLSDRMMAEHWARYRFAASRLGGRLLDLGCGTGYGCGELARRETARAVLGIDASAAALEWAARYYAHPRVEYRRIDVTHPGWESSLGRFDGIVAFEIIEHLADEAPLFTGVERILDAGGTLLLSTPLGRGRGRAAADPFHVHQLRRCEVERLFSAGWEASFFGQTGEWIEPWVAGRRYYTILVCARRRPQGRHR
jgi:cyclopropane fatty-acyl-phospholipid synthase-like methyltransferase